MNLTNAISLCMVVRNEAEFLERCLKAILPAVQEVVLVDTGSEDDTLQIARDFNARIFRFPWQDDFSVARNVSLSLATLPWILVLDADEVLSPTDHGNLAALLHTQDKAAYSLIQRNYVNGSGKLTWTQSWKLNLNEYEEGRGYTGYLDVPVVRLFPRHSAIRFSSRVHESVDDSVTKAGFQIKASKLILHHYGQVRKPDRMKKKKLLYLELGRRKLKEDASPRAHFELGIQYQELGQFEQAIPHFLAAVKDSKEFRVADLYLGICFSKTGKLADARFHLTRARKCFPCSVELYCELGILSTKEGKAQEAISAFRKALAIDNGHVGSLCYLGTLLAAQDQIVEGSGMLEKAVQIDPNHFDSWINLASLYQKSGQRPAFVECLERAYALQPENCNVARQLAFAYADLGKHADAALILSQVVDRDPGNEPLKVYWAALLIVSGREDQGRKVYESILDSGGRFARLARKRLEKMNTRITVVGTS